MKITEKQLRKIIRNTLLEMQLPNHDDFNWAVGYNMDGIIDSRSLKRGRNGKDYSEEDEIKDSNNPKFQKLAMWRAKQDMDREEKQNRNYEMNHIYLKGGDIQKNRDEEKRIEDEYYNTIYEKINKIVAKTIEESFLGLSLDNRLKNGHWHTESNDNNLVIAAAYRLGWNLEKETDNFHVFSFLKNKEEEQEHSKIEGVYSAEIMDGYGNNVTPDKDVTGVEHPKVMWGILIRELNAILMPKGYLATGANNRRERVDLMGKPTNDDTGAETERGTIIVRKFK